MFNFQCPSKIINKKYNNYGNYECATYNSLVFRYFLYIISVVLNRFNFFIILISFPPIKKGLQISLLATAK